MNARKRFNRNVGGRTGSRIALLAALLSGLIIAAGPAAAQKAPRLQLKALPKLPMLRFQAKLGRKALIGRKLIRGRWKTLRGNRIVLTDQASKKDLVLDYNLPRGITLPTKNVGRNITLLLNKIQRPAALVEAMRLTDERGLVFLTENRGVRSVFTRAEKSGFSFVQRRRAQGKAVFKDACMEIYNVPVKVKLGSRELSIAAGRKQNMQKGGNRFEVQVVTSQYVKEIPCRYSFEEAPLRLQYVVKRTN